MEDKISKIFQKAQYHPESQLSNDILFSIITRQARAATIRFWIYSFIGTFSFVGFLFTVKLLITDFAQSGFYEYLSLAFSDNLAFVYWKEIALSITESLPMTNLILLLILVFIFILSLRFLARNTRIRSKLLVA